MLYESRRYIRCRTQQTYAQNTFQQRHNNDTHDKLGIQSGSTLSLRSGVQHFIIGHILATTTVCHDDDYTSAAVQNHYRADNNAMADEPNPDDPYRYSEPDYGPNFHEGPRLPDPFYHPVLDDEGRRINYRVPYNQDEQSDRLPGQTIIVATATILSCLRHLQLGPLRIYQVTDRATTARI